MSQYSRKQKHLSDPYNHQLVAHRSSCAFELTDDNMWPNNNNNGGRQFPSRNSQPNNGPPDQRQGNDATQVRAGRHRFRWERESERLEQLQRHLAESERQRAAAAAEVRRLTDLVSGDRPFSGEPLQHRRNYIPNNSYGLQWSSDEED